MIDVKNVINIGRFGFRVSCDHELSFGTKCQSLSQVSSRNIGKKFTFSFLYIIFLYNDFSATENVNYRPAEEKK